MRKLLMAALSISTGACASLPSLRQPEVIQLPAVEPVAIVPPAECTDPPETFPVFLPGALPPRAAPTADIVAQLKAENARVIAAFEQLNSYTDSLRVWAANKHDEDERCAVWARELAEPKG